jgi:hypothetical protein
MGLVAELLVACRRQEMRNYAIAARTFSPAAAADGASSPEGPEKQ